jgi:hypothetical protein
MIIRKASAKEDRRTIAGVKYVTKTGAQIRVNTRRGNATWA